MLGGDLVLEWALMLALEKVEDWEMEMMGVGWVGAWELGLVVEK